MGKAKSISDQLTECTVDVAEQGWTAVREYQDRVSASRHTTKRRDDWPQVLADIEARRIGVLVLWEPSRGDRDAETWLGLLRRLRDSGVLLRITSHERTYDLRIARDWKSCAEDGLDSHYESEKLSARTRRGVALAAAAGRPPMGMAPYGHRRVYDPSTGELVGQEPDPVTSLVVKEIIARVAKNEPVVQIANDLNARGVPAAKGGIWRRMAVRDTALNLAHIAKREHRGQVHDGGWPALVDEATFYAATRVLKDPVRLAKARPGRQVHLLTYLGECYRGHPLRGRATYYECASGCVGIVRAVLDEFVTEVVLARLELPDAYSALRQAGAEDDREVLAAQDEAARLRNELTGWRVSAARGRTSEESLGVIEADLAARIKKAEARERRAGLPPALRELLEPGADVRARWAEMTLGARRDVIRTLATVIVRASGQNSHVLVEDRVDVLPRETRL